VNFVCVSFLVTNLATESEQNQSNKAKNCNEHYANLAIAIGWLIQIVKQVKPNVPILSSKD